jgi:Fe-S-cluster containining protein
MVLGPLTAKLGASRRRIVPIPKSATREAAPHLLRMGERLEAIADLDGLDGLHRAHTVPAAFFELWRSALAAYDAYVATVVDHAGLEVRCRPGCAACCRSNVPTGVHGPEYVAAYHTYREFPDFEQLHNRACDLADVLYEHLRAVAPRRASVKSDSKPYQEALRRYGRGGHACVFLELGNGTCRIYDVRPIPCRMHLGVTDPALCDPNHERSHEAVTPNLPPPKPIVDRLKKVTARMGLAGHSVSLFQGIANFAHDVMSFEPLRISRPRSDETP